MDFIKYTLARYELINFFFFKEWNLFYSKKKTNEILKKNYMQVQYNWKMKTLNKKMHSLYGNGYKEL